VAFRKIDIDTIALLIGAHAFDSILFQREVQTRAVDQQDQRRVQDARHSQVPDPFDGGPAFHLFLHISSRSLPGMARPK
jgi:hypothetical protein